MTRSSLVLIGTVVAVGIIGGLILRWLGDLLVTVIDGLPAT